VDRHFLWLKHVEGLAHPLIVVFDQVEARKGTYRKAYHFHARNRPQLRGQTFTVENENRLTGEGGILYHTTLLPVQPLFEVFEGNDVFRVDGGVFPPRERVDSDSVEIVELEQARIEISPRGGRLADQFLNVLYATDRGREGNPASELVTANGMYGVQVENWLVLFAPAELSVDRTSYEAPREGPHLLLGVRDGAVFDVLLDGVRVRRATSSKEGVLRFDLIRGGAVEVRRVK
jgi:hypothetical protein